MASRKTDRDGQPTEDDLDLWHKAMREARPLRGRPKPPPAATPPAATPEPPRTTAPEPAPQPKAPVPPKPPPIPPLAAGAVVGVDKRSVDRLRRGKLLPEGQIDLHGLTRERAREALEAFVARSQTSGKRCVLVITGKGTSRAGDRSPADWNEERGVIKRELPHWLNQPPLRDRLLAFVEARPQHGGAGALYLLLKKHRGD